MIFGAIVFALLLDGRSAYGDPQLLNNQVASCGSFDSESPVVAYTRLLKLRTECSQFSDYLSLIGRLALQFQQPAVALESLEKAIMLDPLNGEAQVDYAEALYEIGATAAAIAVNDRLLALDSLPPLLQIELERRQLRWAAENQQDSPDSNFEPVPMVRRQLMFDLGHSGNLNNGIMSDVVNLTIAGTDYAFVLDRDYLAKSGWYARTLYTEESPPNDNEQRSQRYVSITRAQDSAVDSISMGVVSQVAPSQQWQGSRIFAGELSTNDGEMSLSSNWMVGLPLHGWVASDRLSLVTGLSVSSDQERTDLLSAGLRYVDGWQGPDWRVGISSEALFEKALQNRPGDDFSELSGSIELATRIGKGWLSYAYDIGLVRSTQGYSALLSNNAEVRNIVKRQTLGFTFPINTVADFTASASNYNTSSNIDMLRRGHQALMFRLLYRLD